MTTSISREKEKRTSRWPSRRRGKETKEKREKEARKEKKNTARILTTLQRRPEPQVGEIARIPAHKRTNDNFKTR